MPTVGERVKQRRLELTLSQDSLAQRAGISKSFLSDLETGKRSVGAETLLDLGRAMGVSLDYLMTGEESDDQKPEVQIPTPLATLAAEEGLSFRQTLTLLCMQRQIIANRKAAKKNDLDRVNWREFYQAVKKFL
jgi:transcriptional regulator with XRE-family HTH domain